MIGSEAEDYGRIVAETAPYTRRWVDIVECESFSIRRMNAGHDQSQAQFGSAERHGFKPCLELFRRA